MSDNTQGRARPGLWKRLRRRLFREDQPGICAPDILVCLPLFLRDLDLPPWAARACFGLCLFLFLIPVFLYWKPAFSDDYDWPEARTGEERAALRKPYRDSVLIRLVSAGFFLVLALALFLLG